MTKPEFLPNGPDVVIEDTVLIDRPKVQITYHNIENVELGSHFSTASGIPMIEFTVGRENGNSDLL